MRTTVIFLFLIASLQCVSASRLVWSSSSRQVISVEAPTGSGLDEICVIPGVDGVTVSYQPAGGNPQQVRWYRYSSLGGGYAEEVFGSTDGDLSRLVSLEGDMGYIVEEGTQRYCFWVVDYSKHPYSLTALTESPEQECGRVALDVAGSADEIVYYSINGRRMVLSREIVVDYNTLKYDDDAADYRQTAESEILTHFTTTLHLPAPLCQTDFTVTGDRFLRQWGMADVYTSPSFAPRSVSCHTVAEQTQRDADNEIGTASGGDGLGGSAPCEVRFQAAVTDAAIFREWQFSRYPEFDDITLRVSDLDFTHTFTEQGTEYVRFYCANADASCEEYGTTYEISIGTSTLKCPNAFSPLNEDGVNDVWKVSYASIVSFKCSIFNRFGREIISFTNPADGWDGRYGGKFVPAGVYYYVIKARGADGRDYDLSGDINIVDYK
ncbi:MAG: gliding motility-associated C-terminal domain-containing protein [Muribaculaceae bacterium]|nr:gliding motility-associated C-terminal domain-containing protein [Muribaculaceae bacterium]